MKYQVSFRAKTWYLHMWKYHLCYSYILNRAFHTKKLLKWNGLAFHWCLCNKLNITWSLGDTKFLFSCWKNISLVLCTHSWNIFQHSKRNSLSPHGHVITSIYLKYERVLLYSNDRLVGFSIPSLSKRLKIVLSFMSCW